MRTARRPSCSRYRIGGNRLGISIFHFYDTPDSCRPYSMRVDIDGSEIRYYINDELVLSAIDDKYGRGGLGFLAYQVRDAFFDNLEVVKLGK